MAVSYPKKSAQVLAGEKACQKDALAKLTEALEQAGYGGEVKKVRLGE